MIESIDIARIMKDENNPQDYSVKGTKAYYKDELILIDLIEGLKLTEEGLVKDIYYTRMDTI